MSSESGTSQPSKPRPQEVIVSEPNIHNGKASTSVSDSEDMKVTHSVSWLTCQVIFTAALGGFLYGFSANAIAGTLAQPSFIAKFLTTADANARTDGLLGGFLAGCMVGSIGQVPISKRFGRRICNAVAAVIVIIAGAIQAGSVHIAMLLAARVVCGIGAGMVLANSPVYMCEVAPPHARGWLVGMQGIGIITAYIMCASLNLAFSFVEGAYQWRLIFVVLTGVAILHLASLTTLPESPRWLMEKGREDEAREVLVRLHRTKTDPDAVLAHAEVAQIKAQVETEKSLPSGFIYIFSNKHTLKRAYCSIILWVMGQGTGITAIANLIPTIMGGLGFGVTLQLALGVVWTACLVIACAFNVFLLDRVGRVKLLAIGGIGCAAIISVMGALVKFYLGSDNTHGLNATVATYFIFGAFFAATIESTSYVYGSEIWPTHLRSEGSTLAYASFFGNSIAYSSPVSVGLANIGWKFYMIFVAVTTVSAIAIWFTFPETMGLPLEEINGKFGEKVEIDLKTAVIVEKEHESGLVREAISDEK
ncbi:Sugar (and other) transporter [Geosmithia morbida]|uniref:Sugar (And other) transporter n=1 Tax=Geosmithia morbida TaxID=1094350 RepID=A0A9P4YRD5_9HYPO|nr:Sugar (and other) transporter [Geosmithia morbida]KAF4120427.1 Sugar (and other) transporter [Geosmithia morbida]